MKKNHTDTCIPRLIDINHRVLFIVLKLIVYQINIFRKIRDRGLAARRQETGPVIEDGQLVPVRNPFRWMAVYGKVPEKIAY